MEPDLEAQFVTAATVQNVEKLTQIMKNSWAELSENEIGAIAELIRIIHKNAKYGSNISIGILVANLISESRKVEDSKKP